MPPNARALQAPVHGQVPRKGTLGKAPVFRPAIASKKAPSKSADDMARKPRTKKHRFKPGTVALREIRKEQGKTDPFFKKAPFRRLIKWVASQVASGNWFANGIPNFTPDARDSLREMTEAYMVELMHAANLEAIHRKQFTIQPKDIQIARRVRGERD